MIDEQGRQIAATESLTVTEDPWTTTCSSRWSRSTAPSAGTVVDPHLRPDALLSARGHHGHRPGGPPTVHRDAPTTATTASTRHAGHVLGGDHPPPSPPRPRRLACSSILVGGSSRARTSSSTSTRTPRSTSWATSTSRSPTPRLREPIVDDDDRDAHHHPAPRRRRPLRATRGPGSRSHDADPVAGALRSLDVAVNTSEPAAEPSVYRPRSPCPATTSPAEFTITDRDGVHTSTRRPLRNFSVSAGDHVTVSIEAPEARLDHRDRHRPGGARSKLRRQFGPLTVTAERLTGDRRRRVVAVDITEAASGRVHGRVRVRRNAGLLPDRRGPIRSTQLVPLVAPLPQTGSRSDRRRMPTGLFPHRERLARIAHACLRARHREGHRRPSPSSPT